QRVESELAHAAGEKDAADDQAESETQSALHAGSDIVLERALGRAEQIAAIHPGRGHGQQSDPLRKRAARHNQVGDATLFDLTRGHGANQKEQRKEEGEKGQNGFYITGSNSRRAFSIPV